MAKRKGIAQAIYLGFAGLIILGVVLILLDQVVSGISITMNTILPNTIDPSINQVINTSWFWVPGILVLVFALYVLREAIRKDQGGLP